MLDPTLLREWAKHPGTLNLLDELERLREERKLDWEEGRFTAPNSEGTAQLNARALGILTGYADIKNFIVELSEDNK